jgi:hypothetical protein
MTPLMTDLSSMTNTDALHARWKNNTERYRSRRRNGDRRLPAVLSRKQLDNLEERGYLDPDLRGEHAAEVEALRTFLADQLGQGDT